MPPLSAYTPFESLLFFQCLASFSNQPTNFSAISDTLRKNQFIKEDAAFDTNRLSPQALEELYTNLLQEGVDDAASSVPGENSDHIQDGGGPNPKKRKITGGSVAAARQSHSTLVPEVVSQLYARYKDRVTKEIRDEEKRYREISEDIKKLQTDALQEPAAPVPAPQEGKARGDLLGGASAPPTNAKMDIDVKQDVGIVNNGAPTIKAPDNLVDSRAQPTPPHKPTEPLISAETVLTPRPSQGPLNPDANKQQAPPISTPAEVPPQQQLQLQQPHQPHQILQHQAPPAVQTQPPVSPAPLKAPVNGKGTPLAPQPPGDLQPSSKVQVKVPPPPQQPQRLPPQTAPRIGTTPNRNQPVLPPGSTIVFQAQQGPSLPATPTGPRHAQPVETLYSKGTPVAAGSQAVPPLAPAQMPFQHWTAQPPPPASLPATPHVPSPYGAQPMLQRPVMPKQGNFVQQPELPGKPTPGAFQGQFPITPAPPNATQTPQAQVQPLGTPFTGTPSIPAVKPRPPRPSMDTVGSITPWKQTPNLRIDIPETPGSPPRPKPEDISPISDTAPSPIEPVKSRRSKKQIIPPSTENIVTKSEKSVTTRPRRAGSTTSTRSRARSVVSRDEESETDSGVTTQRKIKREAPSTPADLLEDVEMETRAGSRRKAAAATTLGEEMQTKGRPKRKRGASEALEADIPHPTPTRATSSQLVYCTRNFTRTGAPIMNDVAAHKHASIFAKPLTEREAPGYRDLIYRPQDLKSIKSALSQGNKAVAAATEAVSTVPEGESPNPATGTPSKNTAWLAKTPELIPPKAIVNSSQLEKELIRMFANAVMFNPAPDSERGFGPFFEMRKPNESRPRSHHPWELDEGGITRDTREMCDDVEKAVTKWRAAERTTTDESASKSMLSLRGSSGDSNAEITDADNKG